MGSFETEILLLNAVSIHVLNVFGSKIHRHRRLLIKRRRGMKMKQWHNRTMCYQRCESTTDGVSLEMESMVHCSKIVTTQRE